MINMDQCRLSFYAEPRVPTPVLRPMKSNAVHSSVSVTKDAGGLLLQYSDVLLLNDRRIAFTPF